LSKRKCIRIDPNKDKKVAIYLDINCFAEFSTHIYRDSKEKRLEYIFNAIYRDIYTRDIFEMYKDYPGTGTMKLSKGNDNLRVYCKVENIDSVLRLTISTIHSKKNQQLSKKEIRILESIQKREYEYREKWI